MEGSARAGRWLRTVAMAMVALLLAVVAAAAVVAVARVGPRAAVRAAARTPRSHCNEGDEPVEIWAVSRRLDHEDAVKIDEFWEASPDAVQERSAES
jgi:ABC-type glycerol-3-phosphate transport system substrate-binding protein